MPQDSDLSDKLHHLHQMLLTGDPTASSQLAELLLPILMNRLAPQFRLVDGHLVEMAVDDAMMSYLSHPERYDPSRLPLDRYLHMSSRGDLLNLLKGHRTGGVPSRFGDAVELDALSAEPNLEDNSAPDIIDIVQIRNSPIWSHLADLIPDQIDQEIVLLMMDNVRNTEDYAEVLGISHLPPDAQAREVKRNKDRIKKKLQRHLQRSELQIHD